ncbi:hypothetical protein D3C81_1546130 [compost metagenome]
MDLLQLIHQCFINMQAACGIDDDIIQVIVLRMLDSLSGNLYRTNLIPQSEYRNLNLFAQYLQLLDRSGTVYVASYEQRAVIALLEQLGQLA